MRRKGGGKVLAVGVMTLSFLFLGGIVWAQSSLTDDQVQALIAQNRDIQVLNKQIADKSAAISGLDQKIDVYNEAITRKQTEELNLENQLEVIDNDIERTKTEMEKTQLELDSLNLQVHGLDLKIERTKNDTAVTKARVGETLRLLYQGEQKNILEITFGSRTLSDFFSQLTYQKTLQTSLQEDLKKLEDLHTLLTEQRSETTIKQKEASQAQQKFEAEKESMEGEKVFKDNLLEKVSSDEEKFQQLVKDAQSEETKVDAEINSLESKVQAQIDTLRQQAEEKRKNGGKLTDDEEQLLVGDVVFSWPIDSREITCGFHCAGYPFAKWFPHSGIDIRTSSGTPVKAAASGFVGIAKSDGTTALAYVTIEHSSVYSTVYMHLSEVDVTPGQFVHRGEVIGRSGGLPGTPGAGAFSTGAHLHFEVRENGIPVDPLPFLP